MLARWVIPPLLLFFPLLAAFGQGVGSERTTRDTAFWAMFLFNKNINPGTYAEQRSLIVASSEAATVSIAGPGLDTTFFLPSGSAKSIPCGPNGTLQTAVPYVGGYRISSSAPISAYAQNWVESTLDVALLLPESALDTLYCVQDYPSQLYGGEVGFVAIEDSTVLTMTLPCDVESSISTFPLTAGTTLTPVLQRGESYLLQGTASLAGMEVRSNGKPFAMFQGAWNAAVPTTGSGHDHLYEQALPNSQLGMDFLVVGGRGQTGENRIRITATEDDTKIYHSSALIDTISAGQTVEYSFNPTYLDHYSTSRPSVAIVYTGSHQQNTIGDPASMTLIPTGRGISKTDFYIPSSARLNQHYLFVLCPDSIASSMRLDGVPPYAEGTVFDLAFHKVMCIPVSTGFHQLSNTLGSFMAYAYSMGEWEAYAFPLGMRLLESKVRHVVEIYDTLCRATPYDTLCFHFSAVQTDTDDLYAECEQPTDDTIFTLRLHLHLQSPPTADYTFSLSPGDTLVYADSAFCTEGHHLVQRPSDGQCDSLLHIYLSYSPLTLTADRTTICLGESASLHVEGATHPRWSASPDDPSLEGQEEQSSIHVSPRRTTTYSIVDPLGQPVDSITIIVSEAPTLRVEALPPYIDFDHPHLSLTDRSEGCQSSYWSLSDGTTSTQAHFSYQLRHPLPDSLIVHLTSCRQSQCCADTQFALPTLLRSIWFPNVFTPDLAENNAFGCHTTFEITDWELLIYSRQGILLWSSTDPTQTWDGTVDGRRLPQGSYVYRWHLRDRYQTTRQGHGTVTLLR